MQKFVTKSKAKLEETPLIAAEKIKSLHHTLFKSHLGSQKAYGTFQTPSEAPDELPSEIDDSTFLRRHNRGIVDFVLAYKAKKMNRIQRNYQKIYEDKLKEEGLILEYVEINESQDGKTCFVLIHAPFDILCGVAEINQHKMPIQVSDLVAKTHRTGRFTHGFFKRLFCGVNPFSLGSKYDTQPCPTYFTMEFDRSRMEYFLVKDPNHFFDQVDRIRLVYDILSRVTISSNEVDPGEHLKGHKHGGSIGLPYLLNQKVYRAAFPIHDSDEILLDRNKKRVKPEFFWPLRPWLYETWANPRRFMTYQPLDQIRDYFGEKLCMYFAWLGFYTTMLIPLTIIGLICFTYGLATFQSDVPMIDVCFSNFSSTIICRSCSSSYCHYEVLEDYCTYAMINAIFENYSTFAFAVILSFWAILFTELWKKQEARLAIKWDTYDFISEYEPPRPEYQAAAKETRTNPVTQQPEPFISDKNRFRNKLGSFVTVGFLICLVLSVVTAIIIYKIIMEVVFANLNIEFIEIIGTSTFTTVTASCISAICIMVLERIYYALAWKLTENEIPRTQSQFETSYTYKMYLFQFVNYYAALFYLAFIQGNLASTPKDNDLLTDHCSPVGCTFSVTTQLCIILVIKSTLNNIVETLRPIIKISLRRRKNKKSQERIFPEHPRNVPYLRFQKDYDLEPLNGIPLLGEYLEMVLQYGFVVMFSAAFPLAPLFAFMNNVVEIRVDAMKYTCNSRRTLPQRTSGIGTWSQILEIVTRAAILTNACLIAFMTDIIDRVVYKMIYSADGTLNQYMDFTLSVFDTSDWNDPSLIYDEGFGNVTACRYLGYYNPPDAENPYTYSRVWWVLMVIKVGFVPLFQNIVLIFQGCLTYLTADVPQDVVLHVQRNRYVWKEASYRKDEEERRKSKEKSL